MRQGTGESIREANKMKKQVQTCAHGEKQQGNDVGVGDRLSSSRPAGVVDLSEVMEAMSNTRKDVKACQKAIHELCRLAKTPMNVKAIRSDGGIHAVLEVMLAHHDLEILRGGLALLNTIGWDKQQRATDKVKAVLGALQKHRKDVKIQRAGLEALWQLLGPTVRNVRKEERLHWRLETVFDHELSHTGWWRLRE